MITIIDYGVGNIGSLTAALKSIGLEPVVSRDYTVIEKSDALILPGVGAFKDAMQALRDTGLIPYINKHVKAKKPLLGICLGMQMLMSRSYEEGSHEGLSYIDGEVIKFKPNKKIPHMGWNNLTFKRDEPLFKYINQGDDVYFVHSYFISGEHPNCIATTSYSESVCAVIKEHNVMATQFHPEKSGSVGMGILRAFKEMIQ